MLQAYLGAPGARRVGAQHMLDAEYFRRIDALNFTMIHDDGQLAGSLEEADVVLVGVSRTSKTPTSIYLANRGIKVANIPIVPGIPPPAELERVKGPLVVGPDRERRADRPASREPRAVAECRRPQRSLCRQGGHRRRDRLARKLCARHGWPIIDVTRRSIEETAAAIVALRDERTRGGSPGLTGHGAASSWPRHSPTRIAHPQERRRRLRGAAAAGRRAAGRGAAGRGRRVAGRDRAGAGRGQGAGHRRGRPRRLCHRRRPDARGRGRALAQAGHAGGGARPAPRAVRPQPPAPLGGGRRSRRHGRPGAISTARS